MMEEKACHPRRKQRADTAPCSESSAPPSSSSRELDRFTRVTETGECSVDCSGKNCRSCSAALVADCVALCCCPLAVVSLLGLAFIKVPCAMGRRCLGRRKKKENEKRMVCVSRKVGKGEEQAEVEDGCVVVIEADNVLLEMCQVGHLGFGTVSKDETQPNDKCS